MTFYSTLIYQLTGTSSVNRLNMYTAHVANQSVYGIQMAIVIEEQGRTVYVPIDTVQCHVSHCVCTAQCNVHLHVCVHIIHHTSYVHMYVVICDEVVCTCMSYPVGIHLHVCTCLCTLSFPLICNTHTHTHTHIHTHTHSHTHTELPPAVNVSSSKKPRIEQPPGEEGTSST